MSEARALSAPAWVGAFGPLDETAAARLDLSILIVNWNVCALLRDCLRSVREQMRLAPSRYEIIVVDNASTDDSVEMVRAEFPEVTLVVNGDNPGFGAANNQALPLSRGRYVLLLNPDTVVTDHALDRMVEYLDAHGDVGALGCRLLNGDLTFQRWTGGAFPSLWTVTAQSLLLSPLVPVGRRARTLFLGRDVRHDLDVDWVSGACLLLRREALGGSLFDPRFYMYGEDMALCARLRRAGWRVVYSPSMTVVHHHGKSMERQRSSTVLLSALRGPRTFYTMHHGAATVWLYDLVTAVGFVIRWIGFGALATATGRPRYSERARANRAYAARALQVMVGR